MDDGKVPENWDMVTEEESSPIEVETPCKEKKENDSAEGLVETACADPLITHNPVVSTSIIAAAEASLQEIGNDDDIVLGPGGHWGLQNDRSTNSVRVRENEAFGPKVAAWSLPTLSQQWEFSEITHHGRKKQKSLHRRKNKKVDN